MPDISMCKGTDCPMKDTCYRHTAEPSTYQSYFAEPPIEDGKCDYYWKDDRSEDGKKGQKKHLARLKELE